MTPLRISHDTRDIPLSALPRLIAVLALSVSLLCSLSRLCHVTSCSPHTVTVGDGSFELQPTMVEVKLEMKKISS